MAIIGTYVLTDVKTKRFYVGSSYNVEKRISRHINELKQNIHHCLPFQQLWNSNGRVSQTIFQADTREEAYELEQLIIDQNKDNPKLLNIGLGVIGGDNLTRNPNRLEIIAKIKKTLKENYSEMTAFERQLIWGRPGELNWMYGKTHTTEARKKISETQLGNQHWLGKKHSEESKALLTIHAAMRTGERNPFYGKHHSEETKRKVSEAKKGQLPSNIRAVMIDAKTYKSITEASRDLGVVPATILFRLKSSNPRFENYSFATEGPTTIA